MDMNVRHLEIVEYLLELLLYQGAHGKGKEPKPPKEPEYAREREARAEAEQRKAERSLRLMQRLEKD